MANLREIRAELASALVESGWQVYERIPDGLTAKSWPLAILKPTEVDYAVTKGNMATVTFQVEIYASARPQLDKAQKYIDEALSYGTDHSIATAAQALRHVRALSATGIGLYNINNDIPAYGAVVRLEATTS